jgi:hypothetical protein
LLKACPGVAAWALDHTHASEIVARHDENVRVSEPALSRKLALGRLSRITLHMLNRDREIRCAIKASTREPCGTLPG